MNGLFLTGTSSATTNTGTKRTVSRNGLVVWATPCRFAAVPLCKGDNHPGEIKAILPLAKGERRPRSASPIGRSIKRRRRGGRSTTKSDFLCKAVRNWSASSCTRRAEQFIDRFSHLQGCGEWELTHRLTICRETPVQVGFNVSFRRA
jgi:hypothetical protein